MKFKYFQQPFSFNLNGRSHVIFSLGFWVEKNLNSRRSESKYESLGKSFYSLSFNFQKFRIHSLSVSQSNNQSNLSIYYNIPKFRILGCYKPTTLKMNLVLEIRRGQQEKGQGLGGLLKFHQSSPGSGVLPPLEAWLRFHQNPYTPSLFLTVSVFSDHKDNSFSRLFRQWHNLFLNSSVFPLGKVIPRLGLLS